MKTEEYKDQAHKELSRIQAELKAPKSQFNSFGKYKYRSQEDILEGLKKVKGGCCVSLSDEVVEVAGRVYVVATATLVADDGSSVSTKGWAREAESKKGMDSAQVTGATSSYARKYALNGLFAIDDTKDADHGAPPEEVPSQKVTAETLERLTKVSEEICAWNDEFTPERIAAGVKAVSGNKKTEASELTEREATILISKLEKANASK